MSGSGGNVHHVMVAVRYLAPLALSPPVRRPSAILLDTEAKTLYVLNLGGREALVKYSLA